MKLFLVFAFLMLTVLPQAQTNTSQDSDLVVLKFSCSKLESGGGMIRSVQEPDPPMNEPITIVQTPKNEPQEIINRKDLAARRADLRNAEINASLSKKAGKSQIYVYRLQVRNASTKQIKSFAWEYQTSPTLDPLDRQFFCTVKAKPNENKEFELFSPLAPSRVVDAAKAGEKPAKRTDAKVIINKIEYLDGTVWQRPGWNPKTFPAESIQKVESGKCIGL